MRYSAKRTLLFYSILIIIIMLLFGFLLDQFMKEYLLTIVEGQIETDDITDVSKIIWFITVLAICLMLLILFITIYIIFEKYIKPIRSVTNVAQKLAEGKYNARSYETFVGDVAELTASINLLARNLQEMHMQRETQNNRLQAVVENMNSGLLLINEKGYIQLVNRAFLEQFQGNTSDYVGHVYYQAIPGEDVHDVVKDVFMFEEHIQKTVIISTEIDRQFFAISGAPILNHDHAIKGVVLVFHNVTEMKRLEEMRKDFVANVSHELKTPITSIKGFTETLLDGAKDDPEVLSQFLSIIHKESSRIQNLIQDLLELSKLEKEELNLSIEEVTFQDLMVDVLSIARHIAEEKNIQLETNCADRLTVYADRSRLIQLLINLVMNAIHYTKEGGSVVISAEETEDNTKINVTDSGIGIPKEELPRIFERFYRVDKARSRNSGGTGLGLAIVKHIVEAHGGKIKVESEVDRGTSFSIYLPK